MRPVALAVLLVLLAATPAAAHHADSQQNARISALENRVTSLESLVRELDARLDRLEAPSPSPSPTPTASPSATPTPTSTPTATATPSPTASPTASPTPSPTATPTPTVTPTPTPAGFPDASNTGVPDGLALTRDADGIEVRTAGALVDAVSTPWIRVMAPNVTIRRSQVGDGNESMPIVNDSTGLLVEDVTIDGADGTGIMFDNYTARRVEVHGTENGFNAGENTTIVDSWVHDLDTSGDAHTDGIQISGSGNDVLVRHNTIDPVPSGAGCTSPVINSNGSSNNMTVEENRLLGAGCSVALYCPRSPGIAVHVLNNRVQSGVFGYFDSCSDDDVRGNVDDLTGAPVG
jgi:hypothetical protein